MAYRARPMALHPIRVLSARTRRFRSSTWHECPRHSVTHVIALHAPQRAEVPPHATHHALQSTIKRVHRACGKGFVPWPASPPGASPAASRGMPSGEATARRTGTCWHASALLPHRHTCNAFQKDHSCQPLVLIHVLPVSARATARVYAGNSQNRTEASA